MSEILNSSITVLLLKYFYSWYTFTKQSLKDIYCASQTYKLLKGFWVKVKICFRYSFLGKITETTQASQAVLDNSWIAQYLLNLYNRWKGRIIGCLKISLAAALAKGLKDQFYNFPVRTISIIFITLMAVNLFLSIVFQRQISPWGWFMRGLFIFVSINGLFCRADWSIVRKGSIFLRKIQKIE